MIGSRITMEHSCYVKVSKSAHNGTTTDREMQKGFYAAQYPGDVKRDLGHSTADRSDCVTLYLGSGGLNGAQADSSHSHSVVSGNDRHHVVLCIVIHGDGKHHGYGDCICMARGAGIGLAHGCRCGPYGMKTYEPHAGNKQR